MVTFSVTRVLFELMLILYVKTNGCSGCVENEAPTLIWLSALLISWRFLQVVLYEDELADNGISLLTAKVVSHRIEHSA